MLKLDHDLLLYHSSYAEVSEIDLSKCRSGLDFGRGFYVTSSFEQAYRYVPSSVRKAIATGKCSRNFKPEDGRINIYRYHPDPNLLIHYFEEAGLDWLHFVAANRDNSLFPILLEKYLSTDIILVERLRMTIQPERSPFTHRATGANREIRKRML